MAWARRSPTRPPSGLCSGWWSARRSASSAAPSWFARFTRAELDDDLAWSDVSGFAPGRGGLHRVPPHRRAAFGLGSERDDHVKLAILIGSVSAAPLAAVVLRLRNRVYRRIAPEESRDDDADGIPDVFEHEPVEAVRTAAGRAG